MSSHDHESSGIARGDARTSDGAPLRPSRLRWTDPVTGERLAVELWGSEAFLAELVSAGFEPDEETGASSPLIPGGSGRAGGGSRVRPGTDPTGGSSAGSTPPRLAGDAA